MKTDFIELQNGSAPLRIAFAHQGEGPPMVLFHGGSGSRNHWVRNIGPLSRHFHVVAPDLPGYGDSGDIHPDIDLEGYVGTVLDFIFRLLAPDERFHLAGFSYGGLIAAGVAATAPGRLLGLTLQAPSGFGKPTGRDFTLKKPRPELGPQGLWEVYRENLRNMMFHREESVDDVSIGLYRDDIERARFRNWGVSWTDTLMGLLERIRCPMQLIWGAGDRTVVPSIMYRTARCHGVNPRLPVHILPATGHWAQYESAERFNELMLEFHCAIGA